MLQGNHDNLHKEIDQYQHELTALQSSYSQKISNLNKKHKQELQNWQDEKQEYLQRIEELEERLLNPNGAFVYNFVSFKNKVSMCTIFTVPITFCIVKVIFSII